MLVSWMTVWSGINIFLQSSFYITIATKRASNVTLRGTLWTILSYTFELVWIRWKSYLRSQYCDGGERECEINSCQHIDCQILSKELHRQETLCLRIWSWWSHIPSSFFDERCTPFWGKKEVSPLLHWFVSYSWEVWTSAILSGATTCLKTLAWVV
jgi:hypothetical protein